MIVWSFSTFDESASDKLFTFTTFTIPRLHESAQLLGEFLRH
jgi:hypothetical protein